MVTMYGHIKLFVEKREVNELDRLLLKLLGSKLWDKIPRDVIEGTNKFLYLKICSDGGIEITLMLIIFVDVLWYDLLFVDVLWYELLFFLCNVCTSGRSGVT